MKGKISNKSTLAIVYTEVETSGGVAELLHAALATWSHRALAEVIDPATGHMLRFLAIISARVAVLCPNALKLRTGESAVRSAHAQSTYK